MECLLVVVIVGAVALAIVGSRRLQVLNRRLDELNARLQRLETAPVQPAEPRPEPAPIETAPPVLETVPAPEPVPIPVIPPPLPLPEAAPAPGLGARLRALTNQQETADRPAASLEERLGARLPVWIGSIALALAGAFLVKYSFDQGLLSPAIRVALGVVFGVVLLAAGEWLRKPSSTISQGLSAAGIADLFACFLAAVHLYQLISPAVGFAFMALTAIVAVLLSLRQGVMVALIGLAGGFLTPALIRTGEPDARNLFGYLLVLVVAVAAVSWSRGWRMVTAFAWAGGLLWVLVWLEGPFQPGDAPWLSLFLIASAVAAVVADLAQARRAGLPEGKPAAPWSLWLSWGTLAAAISGLALVTGASGYTPIEWAFVGLLAAGILVLARLRPGFEGLIWVAAAAPVVLLAAWGFDLEPAETGRFLWTALAFGILLAGGAYLAHRGAAHPGRWASLSAASGLALFLLAWASTRDDAGFSWGLLAMGLAALYLIASLPVVRRRGLPGTDAALAALAVAATTFISLAVPLELENQWLTVAWALEAAALTWLSGRLRLPALLLMARLLALLTAVRLLLNPEVFNYPIGEHPLFNWLLYGYGVPLLAFAAAAWLARRQEQESWARQLEWGALAFATALATLLIRQFFHPGEPGTLETGFLETGTIAAAWLLLGWGLLAANRRRRESRLDTLEKGGRILLAAGAALAIAWPVLLANPLWDRQEVGTVPVFNLLLWAYGLPAALAVLGARELRPRGSRKVPALLAVTALVLTFVLVSLQVRQAFHGTYLLGPTPVAEQYSYSAAWVLFGIVLLVLGAAYRGQVLRRASLVVMMLAVGKVFLYDTANLSDLYRVFSFLGLGLSLLLLAWVYQRFVFVKEPR
jgi:uncharacterized membrane protein